MEKICLYCGEKFYKNLTESKKYWATKKYCSANCGNESRKGKKVPGHTKLMKKAWEEGKYKNRKPTRYINFGKNQIKEKNPNWKGDKADTYRWKNNYSEYVRLHEQIRKIKGYAKICEHCGSITNVCWANKSHEYKEDLDDWIALCPKCHYQYDKK